MKMRYPIKDVLFILLSFFDVLKQLKTFGTDKSQTARNKYRGSTSKAIPVRFMHVRRALISTTLDT